MQTGFASASSGSTSNSDGTGQTFTHTNNNGHQQSTSSSFPAGVNLNDRFGEPSAFPQQQAGFAQAGFSQQQFPQAGFPNYGNFYAPAGYNPGLQYGPNFPYNPFQFQQPQFNTFPGFNQPLQPYTFGYQPPLATPQEFGRYLNSVQQQYAQ